MWNAAVRPPFRRTTALSFIIWSALSLLATGCRSVPPTVKIGLVAPFEGRWRDVGYDAIYAARLAVREANERSSVPGYRVELVALDDGGDAQAALDAGRTLAADPDLMVAMGHWLPATNEAVAVVYAGLDVPWLQLGAAPLDTVDPALLPADFLDDYAAVTPFDEVAGPQAGATYDATWLALSALRVANTDGPITRQSVASALQSLEYEGVTGVVFQPPAMP
jgi:ABC-type branched-subunit amino acid transport system substrate-binding protein